MIADIDKCYFLLFGQSLYEFCQEFIRISDAAVIAVDFFKFLIRVVYPSHQSGRAQVRIKTFWLALLIKNMAAHKVRDDEPAHFLMWILGDSCCNLRQQACVVREQGDFCGCHKES